MTTNQNDILARAYASLSALQNNLSKMDKPYEVMVEETYVKEYHSVLDRLEKIGFDVTEFRVDASEIKPRLLVSSLDGNRYSDTKYVKRALLLIKVESALGYFTLTTEEPKRTIGFKHE